MAANLLESLVHGIELLFVAGKVLLVDVSVAIVIAMGAPDDADGDEDEEEGEFPIEGEEKFAEPNLVLPSCNLDDELANEDNDGNTNGNTDTHREDGVHATLGEIVLAEERAPGKVEGGEYPNEHANRDHKV